MRTVFLFFVASLLLFACSGDNEIPGDVLPKKKMQEVLWGMISASEYLDGYALKKDSIDKMAIKTKVYSEVFQVNHITKDVFDKSYRFYKDHPELMREILDSLSKRQLPSMEQPRLRDTSVVRMTKPVE